MPVEDENESSSEGEGEVWASMNPILQRIDSPVNEEETLGKMDMAKVLEYWESNHTRSTFDPCPVIQRLAEIFEKETDTYMRKDPDPFDERHPYRTDPKSQLGALLKQLFRREQFLHKLVNDYLRDNYFTRQNIQKSSVELNILSCRLILVIMPGLETTAVFTSEFNSHLSRLYSWAEDSIEPLQSYATGLLASAMEVPDVTSAFRENNTRLVPKILKRLHMMQAFTMSSIAIHPKPTTTASDSANTSIELDSPTTFQRILPAWMEGSVQQSPQRSEVTPSTGAQAQSNNLNTIEFLSEVSNMSNIIGNSPEGSRMYRKMYIPIHPASSETMQMFNLRYLTSMGMYQEFLGLVFENNAMDLIFGYLQNLDKSDTCLAFEALKYLSSLLCHKKFALEFISRKGVELLLKIPRPSLAATGVAITLYYLAYSEEAMDRICCMPKTIIKDLVRYALWLVAHSYDSGKCHAAMFFGLSFQFKAILEEFDAQDGLRKLYNVISVLRILNPSDNEDEDDENDIFNDEVENTSRVLVRHVSVALKRYMETHLFYKYNSLMSQKYPTSMEHSHNIVKAPKATLEQISEQVRTLQEIMPVRAHWAPVDNMLKLGAVITLQKAIALAYEWNSSTRSEIMRSALDVLSVCCVTPRVFLTFCEHLNIPENPTGMCAIVAAASGEVCPDVDIQKSALAVLCNCVCCPIAKREPPNAFKGMGPSRKNKQNTKLSEELIEKVWESFCSNNGIIVLLSLMQIKVPITDADCIRGMACRALAGIARSERVRQIVGKLPLFASGQIQTLMRDPILQEKRAEHVLFQKYALELLERVSGKTKPIKNTLDPSLANIHKANVVAQTKIQYNDKQLFQLIYEHLESKGLYQAAQALQKEAGLPRMITLKAFHQSPFDYKALQTSAHGRNRLRNRMQEVNAAINSFALNDQANNTETPVEAQSNGPHLTPIKLVKKNDRSNAATSTNAITTAASSSFASSTQRSLQKQISSLPESDLEEGDAGKSNNCITLSTIVTEYLTNQHALCNNPMATCPQFDLLTPHKCPDPKPNRLTGENINLTARFFKAQAGYNTVRMDRRYVHSNISPIRTIRSKDFTELQFSCCNIVPSQDLLLAGTQQGEVKIFRVSDGVEKLTYSCHSDCIQDIKSNRKGDLILTSNAWRNPLSALWFRQNESLTSKLRLNDDAYCEFSNLEQDRILGTQANSAVIYDINNGSKISTFTPVYSNNYSKNRATFNPTDELILSDGVLWDVRSGVNIHKFDKLNQTWSGVFHRNGLEIISNTVVWDLRTFHLLQTVPVLDHCQIQFSPLHVLYGISMECSEDDFDDTLSYDTSFKVLDSYDYSSISTFDVKRNIVDLAVSGNGSYIALVEHPPDFDTKQESFLKIYGVGMKSSDQKEDDEHDSEEDSSNSDDDFAFEINYPRRRRSRRNDNNEEDDGDNDGDDNDNDEDDDVNVVDDNNDEDENDDDDDDDDDDAGGWIDMNSSDDDEFENSLFRLSHG